MPAGNRWDLTRRLKGKEYNFIAIEQNFCYSRCGVLLCFVGTVAYNGLIIQPRMIHESLCDRRNYTESKAGTALKNIIRNNT